MKKTTWVVIGAAAALIGAALACTPDVSSGPATAQSAQLTVIAGLTQANIQFTPDDSQVTQGAAFLQTAVAAQVGLTQTAIQPTVAAAVAQTAAAGSTPVPPPATITLAPTPGGAEPTAQSTEAQPAPTSGDATVGTVTGKVCYPASGIPPLTIYARSLGDGHVYQQENPENQSQYIMTGLPDGDYYFFAYTHTGPSNPSSVGIGYTQFVLCGLLASCTDHAMIAVAVNAGQTTTGVDICDSYDASAIPPQP